MKLCLDKYKMKNLWNKSGVFLTNSKWKYLEKILSLKKPPILEIVSSIQYFAWKFPENNPKNNQRIQRVSETKINSDNSPIV